MVVHPTAPISPTFYPSYPLPNIEVTSHVRDCYSSCFYSGSGNSSHWGNGQYCAFYKSTGCTVDAISNYSVAAITSCPPSCLSACADVYCSTFGLLALGGCASSSYNLTAINYLQQSCLTAYTKKTGTKTYVTFNVTMPFTGITLADSIVATREGVNYVKLFNRITTDNQLSTSAMYTSICPYELTGGHSMLSTDVRLCITNAISNEACDGNCIVNVVGVTACFIDSSHTQLKYTKITTKISVMAEALGYQSEKVGILGTNIALTLNTSLASGALSSEIISQSKGLGVTGLINVTGIPYSVTASVLNIAYMTTRSPTKRPTYTPTVIPTKPSTPYPSIYYRKPTIFPTRKPTIILSRSPSSAVKSRPSSSPSTFPSITPTNTPRRTPSYIPTRKPTSRIPYITPMPNLPTGAPILPRKPSLFPTKRPLSPFPSQKPTLTPSKRPVSHASKLKPMF